MDKIQLLKFPAQFTRMKNYIGKEAEEDEEEKE